MEEKRTKILFYRKCEKGETEIGILTGHMECMKDDNRACEVIVSNWSRLPNNEYRWIDNFFGDDFKKARWFKDGLEHARILGKKKGLAMANPVKKTVIDLADFILIFLFLVLILI